LISPVKIVNGGEDLGLDPPEVKVASKIVVSSFAVILRKIFR
jgi:hypothetical protein